MEAKGQQNFYNKAAIVVISSKLSLEYTLSGSGAKSYEMVHNYPLLPVYIVYSLHTVE